MLTSGFLTTFASLVAIVSALSPAQWRAQSIYQVMTDRFARTDGSTNASCDLGKYCGGSWRGLNNHLDYIQGMGFTAVWISPVIQNIPQDTPYGQAYHGYWGQDAYSVNINFGTAADLRALSAALHARGMYLMVDVVVNHMAYDGCGTCVDYSTIHPFNNASYYHPWCIIDYNNATSIKVCSAGDNTVALPDLRTEDSRVRSMWQKWIGQLVRNYTIDGLRLDTAQQVDQSFWKPFQSSAGNMYAVGEVWQGSAAAVCPYQTVLPGLLNYPAYYYITQAFESSNGDLSKLVAGIESMKSTCSDTSLLGSFLENHDNPRFPSLTSDMALAKNAIGFSMLADGIPILYQGQEQHFDGRNVPSNREALWTSGYSKTSPLYTFVKRVNAIRKWAITKNRAYLTSKACAETVDNHTVVLQKGSAGK